MITDYTEGMNMEQFKPIEGVGYYCRTYHVGLNNDLLYAESDDDTLTVWWLIRG